jgi:sugar/nucleoside kinase (ribokinase family)
MSVEESGLYRGRDYTVLRCSAWPVPGESIVDTTGAGDAFIGGFIAAFLNDYSEEVR